MFMALAAKKLFCFQRGVLPREHPLRKEPHTVLAPAQQSGKSLILTRLLFSIQVGMTSHTSLYCSIIPATCSSSCECFTIVTFSRKSITDSTSAVVFGRVSCSSFTLAKPFVTYLKTTAMAGTERAYGIMMLVLSRKLIYAQILFFFI